MGSLVPAQPKLVAPRFGQWLAEQRGQRTYEQIASRVRKLVTGYGLKVGRSAIVRYEQGRIPPWPILAAFAEVYASTPETLVVRLLRSIRVENGRDLLRHSGDQPFEGPIEGGAPDVPASARARIQELETTLATREAQWREVQDVARRLFTIAVGDEGRATARTPAGRGRTPRKVS